MKKLLLIIPSRGRPFKIIDMLRSVHTTINHEHTQVIILLDKDDKSIGQYEEHLPTWVLKRVYDREGDETLTTEIINRAFEEFNEYDYYSVTNDDIHYKTKGWDEALCHPLKISCGQDDTMVEKYGDKHNVICSPGEFPITSVIDGDIVRKIGWLQFPELRHSCGDNIWYWIGRRSGILYNDKNYHTSHISPYFGKCEEDDTYKECNAFDNMEDYYIYKEWLKYRCGKEIIKVMKLKREKELCPTVTQEHKHLQQTV